MNIIKARNVLLKETLQDYFPVEEYQDKYYFLKKLKSIFPELSENKIADAIDYANKNVKSSGTKKKYLNALSSKMFL